MDGALQRIEYLWVQACETGLAFRRIINLRLAQTLRHHGVTDFVNSNEKDFADQGFARVWNPLTA
jgi:hypothetical protein